MSELYKKQFKGNCLGVQLDKKDDGKIEITIIIEDDGKWFPYKNSFSDYWIDDLINQLNKAKQFIKKGEK